MSDEALFIDTNIVMYAAGKEQRYKDACVRITFSIAEGSFHRDIGTPVTDTEVFEEILYRYALVGRWQSGTLICKYFLSLGLEVFPIDSKELERTIALAESYKEKGIPPRDLVHVAVMINHGIRKIVSLDAHFDLISEVTRLAPEDLLKSPAR